MLQPLPGITCRGVRAKPPFPGSKHTLSSTTRHYDAAAKCFVPGNVILVAGDVAERTDDFFEWKSARLLLLEPGRLFGGSTPLCCFLAAACAALHFSLQVFAQAFGDNSG